MDDVVGRLHVAEGARFDSLRTEQTRTKCCSDGTRKDVLETIKRWATSAADDGRKHIFWLNGTGRHWKVHNCDDYR